VQKNSLLDLKNCEVIEFMYIVMKRAWCDIQTALVTLNQLQANKRNHMTMSTHSKKSGTSASKMPTSLDEELQMSLVVPIIKLS
jgi:hypothetical protein